MSSDNESWEVTNTGGTNGSTVKEIKGRAAANFRRWVLQALAGQVRVFASADGTNYPASPLVLSLEPVVDGSDVVTESQGTFVGATSGTRLHYFFGQYKGIKIVQKGSTPAQIALFASID